MKRHLHFYQWLLCLLLSISGSVAAYSQGRVTSLDDLEAGSVIKIYPYGHYGAASLALACSGDQGLTSYEKAGDGGEWTLENAGNGCFYLKNELGYYWAYQDTYPTHSLTCTKDVNSAVKVKLTWDSKNKGVCFWNQKDGKGLNNLYGYNYQYNWHSSSTNYAFDTNTTFEVYSSIGSPFVDYTENNIKYLLKLKRGKAQVLANDYGGDIVIPQTVSYHGETYQVTSLGDESFKNCTRLTSITLPEGITSLGGNCFYGCSSLTSITLPEGVTSLGENCFYYCN